MTPMSKLLLQIKNIPKKNSTMPDFWLTLIFYAVWFMTTIIGLTGFVFAGYTILKGIAAIL